MQRTTLVWHASTGAILAPAPRQIGRVRSVAVSKDGSQVISGSHKGELSVWQADTGAWLADLRGHTGEIWSVAFSPDGSRVVSGSRDGTVRLWNLSAAKTGEALSAENVLFFSTPPKGVSFAPGSPQRLLVAGSAGEVWVYELIPARS